EDRKRMLRVVFFQRKLRVLNKLDGLGARLLNLRITSALERPCGRIDSGDTALWLRSSKALSSSSALPAVLFSQSGFGGAATARSMPLNKRPSASRMCSAVSPTDQRSRPGFQFHCASLTFST